MASVLEPVDEIEEDEPMQMSNRRRDDDEMDITPMIDITFLLLIFFLVAARLDEDTPVELPAARHGAAVAVKLNALILPFLILLSSTRSRSF